METLQDPVNNKLPARPPTPIHATLDVEAGLARARSFLDQKQNAHKPGGVDEERADKEKARGVGGRGDEKEARGSVGYGDEKKVRGSVGHGDHEEKARGRSGARHGDEEKARGRSVAGHGDERKTRGSSAAGHGDEKKTRENSGHGDEKKVKGSIGHGNKKKARGSAGQGEEKKARGSVRDGDHEKEASEEKKGCEEKKGTKGKDEGTVDYVHRGQWLRAAILGANDGLVSIASLMMGVGAVKDDDARSMVVSGLAGLVGGACSMAIGEFVSVYSQRDAEKYDKKRGEEREGGGGGDQSRDKKGSKELVDNDTEANLTQEGGKKSGEDESEVGESSIGPSPWEAAGASGLSFALGALVPLLSAGFIQNQMARMGVMMGVCSAALVCMGAAGSKLSRGSVIKGGARVLLGGWAAMLVTFGLLRLFASSGM